MQNPKEGPNIILIIGAEEKIERLRTQIVRASSWRELFSSEKAQIEDYLKTVVGREKREYTANRTLKAHTVKPHPEGDVHIFERTFEESWNTCQRLTSNGNVIMRFGKGQQETGQEIITPDVGNINHQFSTQNLITPTWSVNLYDELMAQLGINLETVMSYLKGKPATAGWEEKMIKFGTLPQRIGHYIYPDFALEEQAKLMTAHPDLFPTTQPPTV